MRRKIVLILVPLIFTAQSCNLFSLGGSGNQGSGPLGVFLSVDSGDSWHPGKGGEKLGFSSASIYSIFVQASDPKNMVAASSNKGVLASDDYGENWVQLLSDFTAYDAFINPHNEQEIFASGSKTKLAAIYMSPDRGSTWIQVYNEPSGESAVTALEYDATDPNIMYAGLSTGTLLKSDDGGDTWHKYAAFKDRIVDVGVARSAIYVLNIKSGFSRSTDGGETWTTKKIDKSAKVNNTLLLDLEHEDTIYVGSDIGVSRSTDGGETWTKLPLPATVKVANVTAIRLNPDQEGEIYAGIRSTVYRSSDDGASWRTVQLPTNRVIGAIAIDPDEPNRLYTGLRP